ncbi:hypothetical protein ILUMI_12726 [Ignelater luminosus]|uniref:CHHC U11-48K-type domain-containing protein n=1 Tax=Ignelater luminosus TaxID=2038154 RepID=A0A8K0CXX2_IGNLU|nr:hypothetical protein ILUMI_12726 [Ignelater luminosus]
MMTNKSTSQSLVCPYNPAHTMLKERVQTHLIKCRRSCTELKWVPCIFNVTHQIPEQELSYHYETCPDRLGFDKHTFVPETSKNKYPVAPPVVNCSYWDDEDVPTYNPQEHCRNNPVLRNAAIYTQPSAVRRNFRLEERQRMQQFATDQKSQQSTSQERVSAQPRRPMKESEGVINRKELPENARLDIAQLMEKITLDSKVVITPKLNVSTNHNNLEQNGEASIGHLNKEEFPKLGEPQVNRGPMTVGNSSKPMSRGRGRGRHE